MKKQVFDSTKYKELIQIRLRFDHFDNLHSCKTQNPLKKFNLRKITQINYIKERKTAKIWKNYLTVKTNIFETDIIFITI